MSELKKIKITDIESFKDHPFIVEVDTSLRELAQSIKDNGLLNPVVVRTKGSKYEMVSGHRRLKALEVNGVDEVDAWYKSHGYPGMNPKDRELYNHINDCGRGFRYDSDTKTCVDETASNRSWYEKQVLSKHDPKDDLPKCSERSETDQACLKD